MFFWEEGLSDEERGERMGRLMRFAMASSLVLIAMGYAMFLIGNFG